MASERRLAFGQVAAQYDEARPTYPDALVDDVIRFAGAAPGDAAVEVGAGTGKATLLFARRGLKILAIEPSADMAQIARRNTAELPNVVVEEIEFERWRPDRPFGLLLSAQAWHWIDPQVRFRRAAEALGADGVLAAFWNRVDWKSCFLRDELAEAYRRLAPELGGAIGTGPMHPTAGEAETFPRDWQDGAPRPTGFTEPEWRTYAWPQPYSRAEYLSLLETHSDHVLLKPSRRQALLGAIGEVIDRAGGILEIEYVTRLGLARRACGEGAGPG